MRVGFSKFSSVSTVFQYSGLCFFLVFFRKYGSMFFAFDEKNSNVNLLVSADKSWALNFLFFIFCCANVESISFSK